MLVVRNVFSVRIRVLLFLAALLLGVWPDAAAQAMEPAAQAPDKQVLLVLVNKLGFPDLAKMPHLQQLAGQGAVGVMNVNTGGKRSAADSYATMAVGVPSKMQEGALLAYNGSDAVQEASASVTYRQLQGTRPDHGGVLVLSMPKLLSRQSQREYAGSFGGLGESLQRRGLQTAVLGSSDRGPVQWRPATLFTSDLSGQTALGDVGAGVLKSAPSRPYGVRTDYEALWKEYERVRSKASLVVFDLGDVYRLDAYRDQMTPERYESQRGQVLREVDQFVGRLVGEASQKRLVLVASPQVSAAAAANREWLAPLVMAGGDTRAGAVLTSATTRRAGIVSNLDVAPTVLHALGVTPQTEMIGCPLQATSALAPQKMDALYQSSVWTYRHRSLVLTLFGVLAGLALFGAALWLWTGVKLWAAEAVQHLMWAAMAMPLCLYVMPLLRAQGLWETAGGVLALYLLFVAIPFTILPFCQSLSERLSWLSGWTIGVIVFDVWQGAHLAKKSLLSYDPIVGARYYGIGNEYMGVLIGASILLYGSLRQTGRVPERVLRACAFVGGLLLIAFFASPALGTNTGGALTMAGTLALATAYRRRLGFGKTALLLGSSLCGAAVLLVWLNQLAGAEPSHIGAAAKQVLAGGLEEAMRILARKTSMIVRLFTASVWPACMLAALVACVFWLYRAKRPYDGRGADCQGIWHAVGGIVGGAVVGLCTNDSGIVVVAMMLLFAVFPALMVWMEEEEAILLEWQKAA